MRDLDGRVAVVTGLGAGSLARDIALTLAAHGARVVVSGEGERALGEVVGEIASAAGKARHVAGDAAAAVARALDAFGALDVLVCCDEAHAAAALEAGAERMTAGGRLVVVGGSAATRALVRRLGTTLSPRGVAVNAVAAEGASAEAAAVELVAFAATPGARLTGCAVVVRS